MSERVAMLVRGRSRRKDALAAMLAVASTFGLGQALLQTGTQAPPRATRAALAMLPPAARGPVSAALGAASPAYRLAAVGGETLAAENPAQRLSAQFTPAGMSLSTGAVMLHMHLASVGYDHSTTIVPPATPERIGPNRLLYRHGAVQEWYANGPLGIEQGFNVATGPAGTLTLTLALSSNAVPSLSADGSTLTLTRRGGGSLVYGDLLARDAHGRALPARIALHGRRLLLVIDARGAAYPLRIDPLASSSEERLIGGEEAIDEEKIVERDGEKTAEAVAHGSLGYSVALSADGDTALVGAPNDANFTGAAWVFVRVDGEWVQQGHKLTAAEPETGEPCKEQSPESEGCAFGRSVALSADGNTAMIGAPRQSEPCPGEPATQCLNSGAVWVFTRSGSAWTAAGAITASAEEQREGRFGRSVALSADGTTVVVGAPADENGHGSVWAFAGSGSTWVQLGAKVTEAEPAGEAHLGAAVAISGDGSTALAGAPGDSGYRGAAWLLTRVGTSWSGEKLTGAEASGESHFGAAVALSSDGSTALVGGRRDAEGRGAAWVFTNPDGGWTQQGPKLTGGAEEPVAPELDEGDFGTSVALSSDGSTALVGAPHDEHGLGAAWLFARTGSSWSQAGPKLTSKSTHKGLFGTGVALRADALTALVGAPGEPVNETAAEARLDPGAGAAWPFKDPSLAPAVTGVSPSQGPLAGGTTVTITGERLATVQGVSFGKVPAQSFAVGAGGSITAVTPKGIAAGNVCVEVHTPEGVSPDNPCPAAAEFAYLPVPTVTSPPPSGSPGSSTGSTSGPGASAAVLDFGPAAIAGCRPSLVSRTLYVPGGVRAQVKLRWRGTTTCHGKLRLTVNVRAKVGKRTVTVAKTLGTIAYAVPAGKQKTFSVTLNYLGRSLLQAAHVPLRAGLSLLAAHGKAVIARAINVRLVLRPAPPVKKPKT